MAHQFLLGVVSLHVFSNHLCSESRDSLSCTSEAQMVLCWSLSCSKKLLFDMIQHCCQLCLSDLKLKKRVLYFLETRAGFVVALIMKHCW